jgi:predicted TIM-barrel fold metal-dependent hydrolase
MAKLQIVDPHIHLWDLWTRIYPHFEKPGPGGENATICRSYLIEEYLEEGRDAFEIVGAVHVEAFPTDPIKETQTLQQVADANPLPLVIVGNGDLGSPQFPALLDRHQQYPIFRGIRQVVNMHPDPRRSYTTRDLMAEPQFLEGLRELGRRGLSFDLQLYPHQMETAAALAAKAPDTRIILNHAGMWADRDLAGWRQWKAGMRTLAAQPNIVAKISGLAMLDEQWTTESIRPLVLESIEAFGPERAMFASNFPVDKQYSDFVTVWRAFDTITAGFSEAERAGLFRDNARNYYRIPA